MYLTLSENLLSNYKQFSVQFSHSVVSDSLWPHGLHHARPPCLSPTPGVYLNACPLSRWCHPTISSLLSPSPGLNHFQNQGLFQWVSSSHQVAKVLQFQLQHQSFQWIFRTDFLQDGLVGSPCSAYLTYMQSTSWETLGWRKHKLESRLLGEISITSDIQMTPPLWQKVEKNWRAS